MSWTEKTPANWTTKTEINFIKGLGMGVFAIESSRVKLKSRKEMLLGYLEGTELRENWADIDKKEVVAFAREELHQLG